MLVAAAVCFILIAQLVTHWRNGAQIKTSREWKTRVPAPEGNRPVPGSQTRARRHERSEGKFGVVDVGGDKNIWSEVSCFFASGAVKVSLLRFGVSPPSSLWAEKQISVA
jgi:hypothetical protein